MSGPLTTILNVTPKNDDLETAFTKANQNARNEEGTLTHRMFRQADGNVIFYEDYASSEAFVAHVGAAQQAGILDELMAACDVNEVLCLGEPTPEATEVLNQFGANVAGHVAGFSKLGMQTTTA